MILKSDISHNVKVTESQDNFQIRLPFSCKRTISVHLELKKEYGYRSWTALSMVELGT